MLQIGQQSGGADALRGLFDRNPIDAAIGRENNCGGDGNASALARIEQIPSLDLAAVGIAEQGEGQIEASLQCLGTRSGINGDGGEVVAELNEGGGMVAKVRQLAEAERSPVTAVKEEDESARTRER